MYPTQNKQVAIRLEKKAGLEKLGISPYPSVHFLTNTTTVAIIQNFKNAPEKFQQIKIAGRLMNYRMMGSAAFAELQDAHGKIQLYIKRDQICPEEDKTLYNTVFKKLLDIGDIIGVHGNVFTTKVGEISINVKYFILLTKSLAPLPIVKTKDDVTFDRFSNPEHRYRQRYVDLIVNPEVKHVFKQRSKMIQTIRGYFDQQGYLEVETPILQPVYGGATARPFKTHHHTLDMPLYLRIANELYLKRLIVGGYEGVYEFAKDFRNEGMSRFHNPEFTQVEIYVAYKNYHWMMHFVEDLVEKIAYNLHSSTQVNVGAHVIDFKKPWQRFTMFEVIEHFTKIDIRSMDEEALRGVAKQLDISLDASAHKGKIIDEIFGKKCEPYLIQPTFITDYPVEMSPLAKQHADNPSLVERFEVICNGKEICNAFSELNDPVEQRKRFEEQLSYAKRGDQEAMVLDEDFLRALSYGMPPTAGLGMGIDRLAMIMTNMPSIQEVIFFPQMKCE